MDGVCQSCGAVVAAASATGHVRKCYAAHVPASAEPTPALHLVVKDRYNPDYWLHLLVPAEESLYALDAYLRGIWVQCCGHLSEFRTKDAVYDSEPDDDMPSSSAGMPDDLKRAFELLGVDPRSMPALRGRPAQRDMACAVGEALPRGAKANYTYDFGSSTELTIETKAAADLPMRTPASIVLLARNNPPDRPCAECGQPAKRVCAYCLYEGGWYCEACSVDHECGDEALLPVVNSPRVGVCGYGGPADPPVARYDDEVPAAQQLLYQAATACLTAFCDEHLPDFREVARHVLLDAACGGLLATQPATAEVWAAATLGTVAKRYSVYNPSWPKGMTAGRIADRFDVPRLVASRLARTMAEAPPDDDQ
ncbi:MAG: hypothetical protein HZB16_12155 [Armatimonadetes bacterium]|nr:hypothetical protein [Armatimonadota bacterium]